MTPGNAGAARRKVWMMGRLEHGTVRFALSFVTRTRDADILQTLQAAANPVMSMRARSCSGMFSLKKIEHPFVRPENPSFRPDPYMTSAARAQAEGKAASAKRWPSRRDPCASSAWVGAGQPCRKRARRQPRHGRGASFDASSVQKIFHRKHVHACAEKAAYVKRCSALHIIARVYGMSQKKLRITKETIADEMDEARTVKRGVARCGFDIDITAYADIDIKIPLAGEGAPHSPGPLRSECVTAPRTQSL